MNAQIDALEGLMRKAIRKLQIADRFIDGTQMLIERRTDPVHCHEQVDAIGRLERELDSLCEMIIRRAYLPDVARSAISTAALYHIIEEANLDHLQPVHLGREGFLTATEAAGHVARAIREDCKLWGGAEDRKGCQRLVNKWEPFRNFLCHGSLLVKIECRRAIRDEYEWLERQQSGEIPSGTLRYREKVATRQLLSRKLRRENETGNEWARLALILNADPEYQALAMGNATKHDVRNDCKPRRRSRNDGGGNFGR